MHNCKTKMLRKWVTFMIHIYADKYRVHVWVTKPQQNNKNSHTNVPLSLENPTSLHMHEVKWCPVKYCPVKCQQHQKHFKFDLHYWSKLYNFWRSNCIQISEHGIFTLKNLLAKRVIHYKFLDRNLHAMRMAKRPFLL